VKARVVQTFYVPETYKLYKYGEEIDVSPDFARTYSPCLLTEKTAPAPVNKMVTAEKEVVKTKKGKK